MQFQSKSAFLVYSFSTVS